MSSQNKPISANYVKITEGVSYFEAFGRRDLLVSIFLYRGGLSPAMAQEPFFLSYRGALGCHTRIRAGFLRECHRHDVCFPSVVRERPLPNGSGLGDPDLQSLGRVNDGEGQALALR